MSSLKNLLITLLFTMNNQRMLQYAPLLLQQPSKSAMMLATTVETQRRGRGGGGGDSLIKVATNVRAQALGFLGVNFCPGIRFFGNF